VTSDEVEYLRSHGFSREYLEDLMWQHINYPLPSEVLIMLMKKRRKVKIKEIFL